MVRKSIAQGATGRGEGGRREGECNAYSVEMDDDETAVYARRMHSHIPGRRT